MEKKQRKKCAVSKTTVILFGLCAVMWTINCIISVSESLRAGYQPDVSVWLKVACAVIWIVGTIKWWIDINSSRTKTTETNREGLMEKKQRKKYAVSKTTVILFGLCAVMWTINCILSFAEGLRAGYELDIWIWLKAACAVIWTAGAVKWWVVYKQQQNEKDGEK